ncbi:MAG TPA: sugar phosphate nucleotidyltransferase, partial [Paracoccus sp. (in: a-proteobacteria)]|nr:sugar phosphate nucleotidyltransferase [Paracoccus sp. (in: a-proteobacteria)]
MSGDRYGAPLVMTNADFRFIVAEQLDQIGIDPEAILIEPAGRNTAPAILAAALLAAERDPDAVLLVAPSDHVVPDAEGFGRAVDLGLPAAQAGRIVTFGITPTRPETGYGYMEAEGEGQGPLVLKRFVEKPNAADAAQMIAQGDFLWNGGIFLFAARTMIGAFKSHAPEYLAPVQAALTEARTDLGFLRLAPEPWDRLPDLSIDYAVLEKAANLSVVRYSGHWSDLGGWDAVWREIQTDAPAERGAVTDVRSTAIDCDGLQDVMVVATNDAVLVAGMDRAQEVRKAVSALKDKGARQAETFLRDHRPWGWFETLALADRFQVKRIVVNPGAALSL